MILKLFLAAALLGLPLALTTNYGRLFAEEGFNGASRYIEVGDGDRACYNILDFNDRAKSIRVWGGGCWELWDNANCDIGQPVLVVTADRSTFYYFNNKVSSVKGCKY